MGCDPGRPAVADANQTAAAGSDPKRVRRLRVNRPDAVSTESGESRVGHEPSAVKAVEAAVRAHQHVAVMVFRNGANPSVRQPFFEIIIPQARAVPPADSAGSADPQIPVAVLEQRLNAVVAQAVRFGESGRLPVDEMHDTLTVGAEPQSAVVVLECAANPKCVRGRRQFSRVDPAIGVLEDSASDGRKPHVAPVATVNRQNIVPGEPATAVEHVDIGSAQSYQPICRTNPDAVFAVFQNRENAVVRQVRRRAKHRFQAIMHPVEPIAIGAKPHVSVVVFKNRTDHVFGVGTRGILGRLPEDAKPVVSAEPERSVPGKAEVMDPLAVRVLLCNDAVLHLRNRRGLRVQRQ